MTIVEAPKEVETVYSGRMRAVSAVALVTGPLLMLLAFLASAWAEQAASGKDDLAVAMAAPTRAAIASLFDILSVPAMLAFTIVLFQVTRRWSPRAAWIGSVAMFLQLCGLAAVVGVEVFSAILAQHGVDPAVINNVSSNDMGSNAAAVAVFIMFMPMEVVALIALGIALWRTRWVPKVVPVLMWLFPVADMATPDHPKILHVVAFAVFLAAFSVLAHRVAGTGAELPPSMGQTA